MWRRARPAPSQTLSSRRRSCKDSLLGDGIDVRGRRPRQLTRADVESATRVITFGCELGELAPPGLALEHWDDVPAVSEDFKRARDAIVARLPRLLDECAK